MDKSDRKDDPFQTELTNSPHNDVFTCPACYDDFNGTSEGILTCQSCGSQVQAEIEMAPVYKTTLIQ